MLTFREELEDKGGLSKGQIGAPFSDVDASAFSKSTLTWYPVSTAGVGNQPAALVGMTFLSVLVRLCTCPLGPLQRPGRAAPVLLIQPAQAGSIAQHQSRLRIQEGWFTAVMIQRTLLVCKGSCAGEAGAAHGGGRAEGGLQRQTHVPCSDLRFFYPACILLSILFLCRGPGAGEAGAADGGRRATGGARCGAGIRPQRRPPLHRRQWQPLQQAGQQ